MDHNYQKLRFFRNHIPQFACVPGCHDCCGPVLASSIEMSLLPTVSDENRATAITNWNCVHLTAEGCGAYEDRPLICRLFGTTPSLVCPRGQHPDVMTHPKVKADLNKYFKEFRHVLI